MYYSQPKIETIKSRIITPNIAIKYLRAIHRKDKIISVLDKK